MGREQQDDDQLGLYPKSEPFPLSLSESKLTLSRTPSFGFPTATV